MKKSDLLLFCLLVFFGSSSIDAAGWSRTAIAKTFLLYDTSGIPILDQYGDPIPSLPGGYLPSSESFGDELHVLVSKSFSTAEPPEYDENGFPVLGNYFQLNDLSLSSSLWVADAAFTDRLTDMAGPQFASGMDGILTTYFWREHLLTIDQISGDSPQRRVLPIVAERGSVAVDANGGIHIVAIRSNAELWHSYFAGEALTHTKLSDGPVCEVVIVAGEEDQCHVAYATFSEDQNFNDTLDEGEDLNGNGLLEDIDQQLIYQTVDASSPATSEIVLSDTILKLCVFDLLFSSSEGVKLAYASPVFNSVSLAERAQAGGWSSTTISTTSGLFGWLAAAMKENGDCSVSFIPKDGSQILIAEETTGVWAESLVAESSIPEFFRGTDLVFDSSGNPIVLASEKDLYYLTAYAESALPEVFSTTTQPVDLRPAFIISWPEVADGVDRQYLQQNGDLSDPDGWRNVDVSDSTFNWETDRNELAVEPEGDKQFFRVLEVLD